jgi:hypothetical protein
LAVLELNEHRHAAEGIRKVDALFRILHHEVATILPGHEAAQISEEVSPRYEQTLDDRGQVEAFEPAEVRIALDLDHITRHARKIAASRCSAQRMPQAREKLRRVLLGFRGNRIGPAAGRG